MYSGVEYAAEHFSTEVKYLEKMGRHEHIVRIYECFNDETQAASGRYWSLRAWRD